MKTFAVLIVLLFVNILALFAETIGKLIKELNVWILFFFEAILVISYCLNDLMKGVQKKSKLNMSNLTSFSIKGNGRRSA